MRPQPSIQYYAMEIIALSQPGVEEMPSAALLILFQGVRGFCAYTLA